MDRKIKISRLENRLARRFDLTTETIPVGPLRVQFTRVKDPEKVLDDLCAKIDAHEQATGTRIAGDDLGLPYWAELWDSSIGVGHWLIRESENWRPTKQEIADGVSPRSKTVLDLGCGMGLAGTVAALLGAEVTFGDIEKDCLLFSALNGLRYSEHVKSRKVNWQKDDLKEKFDLIIGSDVLYDKTQWEYLHPFFQKHLVKSGKIILGEPGRQTGELFVPWIQERGWVLKEQRETVPTRSVPIRLFELTAK